MFLTKGFPRRNSQQEKRRYMPKYQVCPYCRAKSRYKDVNSIKGKQLKCYRCKKRFAVKKIYKAVPIAIACILMVIADLTLFNTVPDIRKETFILIVLMDAAVILTAFVISPLFVRFYGLPKRLRKEDKE